MTFYPFVPLLKVQIVDLGSFHKKLWLREFSVVMQKACRICYNTVCLYTQSDCHISFFDIWVIIYPIQRRPLNLINFSAPIVFNVIYFKYYSM